MRGAAACALALLLAACGDARGPADAPAPESPFTAGFEDATVASGLRFRHHSGRHGRKLLPETLGSGVGLLDHDGDGDLDVFLVDSTAWRAQDEPGRCALWRNRGDATFEDVTAETGAGLVLYGMGCAVADHDGDGDPDIYVTAVGRNVLLRNDGGRFVDVTESAGVAGGTWAGDDGPVDHWSTASAWLDADGDGRLDLLVGGYCKWTPRTDIFTTLDGRTKAFTTPDRYEGLPCRLYLNRGERFEDATAAWGLTGHLGKALGMAVWDFDGDGRPDVVVANDTRPNFLFMNAGDRFDEAGERLGVAYDEDGRARAGMGVDVAVCDGSAPAIAIGNFSAEPLSLFRRTDDGSFAPHARAAGLAAPSFNPLTFGLLFRDLDLDGLLDLVVVNGHIEPDISRIDEAQTHAQGAQVFRGVAGGAFVDATDAAGDGFTVPRVGRGLAAGDLDGDGDLDLVVTKNNGPAAVLLNRTQETRPRSWLRVDLLDTTSKNRAAIGARVTLSAGGRTQVRMVRTGSSYLSASETTLTFGLGDAKRVESLKVRWPDGRESVETVEAIDRRIVIRR